MVVLLETALIKQKFGNSNFFTYFCIVRRGQVKKSTKTIAKLIFYLKFYIMNKKKKATEKELKDFACKVFEQNIDRNIDAVIEMINTEKETENN